MAAAAQATIPVVVIGYARSNGIKTMPRTFENTPYTMTAFLDVQDSPSHLQFTKHNLEVVLNSLHPRPRALIIGPAIHPSIAGDMSEVWESYVQRALRGEGEDDSWKKSAFVSLPDFHYIDPKTVKGSPPDAGWYAEMFRQLEAAFASQESCA
ncbi:hypothetical protein M409DRAFT_57688 [Zasmidium cellare ATCC 36951]|uniref:Uncharacterized protein n=1 Tax=Zasmidium cellare ATCC 36951 TaxID=1080233 RepID=A0A6A6C7I4_ZASCE|nr:uncharacterized protein M409DRAFT_57688 [Zasmidium cellare ATCC 36951]KAF2163005.1 hypothetical protein M409DRAFT_57688 [Zasmidium cellare ATCC 36951]